MTTQLPESGDFVKGEIPDPWTHTFTDLNGAAIDLTSYDVEGYVTRTRGTSTITLTAVIAPDQTANKGEVTVTWTGTEFAEPGVYRGTLWVGNGTNRYGENFTYNVEDRTGSTPTV